MDKGKLLKKLSEKYPSLGKKYVEDIVNIFFRTIAKNLKDDNRVEVRNFGVFKVKDLKERKIYNPHSGKLEEVSKKKIPSYKCSKNLHKIEE